MSIESTQITNPVKVIQFPKLMINSDEDLIVLFKSSMEGTVVWRKSDGAFFSIGMVLTRLKIENFVDFDGEVTLKNSK